MKKKDNSSNYIYREIKRQIMFLELYPGQSINEVETAKKFNVSRTPIRDAFKHLEVEGLVEVHRGNGTFVSLIDIDEIDEIMYMREKLELAVIKDIGPLSRSQEIKLDLLIFKQRSLLDSDLDDFTLSKKFFEYDNEFHEAIFTIANKINVWKRISTDRPHYNRLRILTNLYNRDELEKLYKEHSIILKCIVNQEYDKLEAYYKDHIYRGMCNLSNIVNSNRAFFVEALDA